MLVCFGAGLLHKQKICPQAGSPKEIFDKRVEAILSVDDPNHRMFVD
jgi:hypothetical protein